MLLSALATEFVGAQSRSPALLLSSHEQDDCITPDEPGKDIIKVQRFWANVKRLQWTFQSRKSGHFEPRICGHLIPRLTILKQVPGVYLPPSLSSQGY